MTESAPLVDGIHHLKVFVEDLDESLEWWEKALDARREADKDHRTAEGALYAYLLAVPGVSIPIELRLSPVGASRQSGFDPVTLLVKDREALTMLAARWDESQIEHSPTLRGEAGWVMAIRTPDGLSIRFYTSESHEWGGDVDLDSPWLTTPGGLVTS